jgi:hypothetical protein
LLANEDSHISRVVTEIESDKLRIECKMLQEQMAAQKKTNKTV